MTRKTRIAMFTFAAAIAATGLIALAGDLDPPAGPIGPTMKTLAEVEPRTAINATNTPGDADSLFKITQPGSYYLTGSITGVAGKHGIEVAVGGVTLDLNGLDLVGIAGMGAFDGVSATIAGLRNIAVVNGSIRNWGDEGVDLGFLDARNIRVEGVLASGNTGNGIVAGSCGTITNCSAFLNTGSGIVAAGTGGTVSSCSAYANGGNGMSVSTGGTVTNCSAIGNTSHGINTSAGCTVANCSVYDNAGSGISTNSGSTVGDCTAHGNSLDGIVCASQCVIRGNTCASNGDLAGNGAGIHATGSDNRIEGNNCTQADRGIDVDAAGNIVIRNTCAGNATNYDIAADNRYGVIVNITAGGTPAVAGNNAAGTLTTTDPWANCAY